MRMLVDISESHIREFDDLSKQDGRSRAALIREAVDDYLAKRRGKRGGDAFGLWVKCEVDGPTYQKKMRREW